MRASRRHGWAWCQPSALDDLLVAVTAPATDARLVPHCPPGLVHFLGAADRVANCSGSNGSR